MASGYQIPGLGEKLVCAKEGDVNIGVAFILHNNEQSRDILCAHSPILIGDETRMTQGVVYIIDKMNQEKILPRNLTLGFRISGLCLKESFATEVDMLQFFPETRCVAEDSNVCTDHSINTSPHQGTGKPPFWIGVVSNALSQQIKYISVILTLIRLPILSLVASDDAFSDKVRHPYLSRITPRLEYQMRALYSLILKMGWRQVSVIYVDTFFGQSAFDILKSRKLCFGAVHKLKFKYQYTAEELNTTVQSLVRHNHTRVVVCILWGWQVHAVVREMARQGVPPDHFVLVLHNAFLVFGLMHVELPQKGFEYLEYFKGAHALRFPYAFVNDFDQWLLRRTLDDVPKDPWFQALYEHSCNCSVDRSCDARMPMGNCSLPSRKLVPNYFTGYYLDALVTLAKAAGRVLNSTECAGAQDYRQCLTGPRINHEIRNTKTNDSYSGYLELDDNGDRPTLIEMFQLQLVKNESQQTVKLEARVVGNFNPATGKLVVNKETVATLSSILSVCSQNCRNNRLLGCCFKCSVCSHNERILPRKSRCEACPVYH